MINVVKAKFFHLLKTKKTTSDLDLSKKTKKKVEVAKITDRETKSNEEGDITMFLRQKILEWA